MEALNNLTDEQLKARLIEEYTHADDNDVIFLLRDEMYERGFGVEDIVEVAIAALMRRTQSGHIVSLN